MSEKTIERQVIDQILELKTKNEKELVDRIKVLEEEKECMRMEYQNIISQLENKLECVLNEKDCLLSENYHIKNIIKEGENDK